MLELRRNLSSQCGNEYSDSKWNQAVINSKEKNGYTSKEM